MGQHTVLGTGISFMCYVSAYLFFAYSVLTNNEGWIMVSALIYSLPVVVELGESFQCERVSSKKAFMFKTGCFVLGVIYLAILLFGLNVKKETMNESLWIAYRLLLAVLPVVYIFHRAIPFFTTVMQAYNRSRGAERQQG